MAGEEEGIQDRNSAWNIKSVPLAVGYPVSGPWESTRGKPGHGALGGLPGGDVGRFRSLTYFTSEETNTKRDRVCYLRSPRVVTVFVLLGFRHYLLRTATVAFVKVKI